MVTGIIARFFLILCEKYLISPSVALENQEIKEALKASNFEKIEEILKNQF